MRLVKKVLLASLNRDKFEEFLSLLQDYPEVELVPIETIVRNPDGLKFAEKHQSYFDNASAKARLANHASHYPSLADDSGLEVDALGGRPGVRSHRYATPKPKLTQDQANVEFLLSEMKNVTNRSARFVCNLALIVEGVLLHATGILEGTIADHPRGSHGFGYDCVFIPKGESRTLAEMTESEKNAVSHRGKAVHELMERVKAHGIIFAKP